MYFLRTLGDTDLTGDDGRVVDCVLVQPKRFALLVYLAHRARPTTRDELLCRFWPELDTAHARQSLNQALRFLRRSLDARVIVSRGENAVGIDASTIALDVTEFDAARRRGDDATAARLYGGDFLSGFFVSNASAELDEWMANERARLRRAATASVWRLADQAIGDNDAGTARHFASRAVALSPDDETGVSRFMAILSATGDSYAAIRAYGDFTARLQRDVGAAPSLELRQAVAAIRRRASPRAIGTAGAPAAASPVIQAVTTRPRAEAITTRNRRIGRRSLFGVAAVVAVIALGIAIVTAPAPTARVTVDPLTNSTGDTSLDPLGRIVAQRLVAAVQRAGAIDVASSSAPSLRGDLAISGAYYVLKESLFYQVQVTDRRHGVVRGPPIVSAAALGDPLRGLEVLADRAAGTLAMLMDARLASMVAVSGTAPTLHAYREYARGLDAELRTGDRAAALAHFALSRSADTTYLAPVIATANLRPQVPPVAPLDSFMKVVARRRSDLSRIERLELERWEGIRRGDLEAAHAASRELAGLAPHSYFAQLLSADAASTLHLREAVQALAPLDPRWRWVSDWQGYWAALAYNLHELGDYRRELDVARRARATRPDYLRFLWLEVQALVALGRIDDVRRRLDESTLLAARGASSPSDSWSPGDVLRNAALELRAHGHPTLANEALERSDRWFATHLASGGSARRQYNRMQRLEELERWSDAKAIADSIVVARGPFDVAAHRVIGRAASVMGDSGLARRELALLLADEDSSHVADRLYAAAGIATQLGDHDSGMDLLERAFALGRRHVFWDHLAPEFEPLRTMNRYRALMAPRE